MQDPIVVTVQHPSTVSAADVLGIVNTAIDTDAPFIVQALPVSSASSGKISAYVGLGEIGLGVITSIINAIRAKHQQASAGATQTS